MNTIMLNARINLRSNSCLFLTANKFGKNSSLLERDSTLHRNTMQIQRKLHIRKILAYFNPPDKVLKINDKMDTHYQIIYKGDSTNYIRHGYSIVFAGTVFSATTLILKSTLLMESSSLYSQGIPLQIACGLAFYLALLGGIHSIAKVYVHRIYYSREEDKYFAILMSNHPFAEKKIEVMPGEISPYDSSKSKLLPWKDLLYQMDDKTVLFLAAHRFSTPYHFNRLLNIK